MRRASLRSSLPLLLCFLVACTAEDPVPEPSSMEPGGPAVMPRVLSEAQKLAAALATTPFGVDQLPVGLKPRGGDVTRPAEKVRKFNAEAKVTLDFDGPHASDRLSYTVYTSPADALQGFSVIGDPVPDRKILSSEKLALEGLAGPAWAEAALEEYQGKKFQRTTMATVSGPAVVLAQVIVEVKDEPAPAPPRDFSLALLNGGLAHLAGLLPGAAPAPAGTSAAPDPAATPSPTP